VTERPAPSQPLVTVGVPLFRSRRFLDVVIENVEAIRYPNVEVIFSDRHLHDDSLEVLRRRFGSDPRFRFLGATDGLSWVGNYNLLLREARGEYAVWMPHDDSYPPGYVGELVAALEARPDAVLAFGEVEQLSADGFLPTLPFSPPPVSPDASWTFGSALRMLTLWQLWFAFRGVVRRRVVVEHDLYVRPTRRDIRADIYWVFGLALHGRLLFVPSARCTKRFYRASTGAGWRIDLRQGLDACHVLHGYLRDHAPSRGAALLGRVVLDPWCLVQSVLPSAANRRLFGAWERLRARSRTSDRIEPSGERPSI